MNITLTCKTFLLSLDIPNETLDSELFRKYLGKFLYSPIGSKHRGFFKLQGNFSCGDELPPIKVCDYFLCQNQTKIDLFQNSTM